MQDYDLVQPSEILVESSWAKHHLECDCKLRPTLLDPKMGQQINQTFETLMIP